MPKRRVTDLERAMSEAHDPRASVAADMARLKGFSSSNLIEDKARGATSPLGMGSHSAKKMERKKGK
jgi:hypothetical protein